MEKKDIALDEFFRELEERERSLLLVESNSVEIEVESYKPEDSIDLSFKTPSEKDTYKIPQKSIDKSTDPSLEISLQRAMLEKEREELDRLQKDIENHRKRIEQERIETMGNLMIDLARRLLPLVDNLERAIESGKRNPVLRSVECKSFLDGIILVSQQLYEILAEMGVEPIPALGMPFDPSLHEAVDVEKNSSVPQNIIVAELLRGYRLGDKIVRHSLVKVAVNDSHKNH
ncbi:MAG: nucleotide exchange factor GrpE [Acidobacteria bacterium]|nr:MAG: nucleotide exchange factor GrpE [Acidobacteriota bacterium]